MGDVWKTAKPFVNGGLAGSMATCVVQPIDMVKVRIQLEGGNPLTVGKNIVAQEGFGALYKGLSAGILRQCTYTTARLGFFKTITNYTSEGGTKTLPLWQKACNGLAAGAFGATFGNPADLALLRMQADATLPAAERRGYTNVFNALGRIVSEEGVLALWTGAGPTVVRAMALNMGMMASYDQTKEMLAANLGPGHDQMVVLGGSAVSGIVAATCSLPFDFVKTQMQKQTPDKVTGKMPYSSMMDCAGKILAKDGPFKFYTGYPTFCIRIAPHVMMTWIFMETITAKQKAMGF